MKKEIGTPKAIRASPKTLAQTWHKPGGFYWLKSPDSRETIHAHVLERQGGLDMNDKILSYQDSWYLVAEVRVMSFRPKGEIFSSFIKDFSVTSFLRNDTVIYATKY